MELKRLYGKYENGILAAALVGLMLLFAALNYDFYYDLNDDVLMKDILSGVYTGTPESRNLQMLYPLSLLLSVGYRIFPQVPVYGIFLCVCQFGCLFLIAKRSLTFRRSTGAKLFMALFEGVIFTGLFLRHLVFIQYTVTAALLAATAAFLFLTVDVRLPVKTFIQRNGISMALAVCAFLLRSEMLLLLLPLICVAGVLQWSRERPAITKENFVKYLAVFIGICAGLLVSYGVDRIAYSGTEWKEFREFFDSRTALYDFQGIPSYEENEALYESLGMTRSAQELLFNRYNFGMDENVNAALLDALSARQAQVNEELRPFGVRLRESLENYFYRTFHREAPAGSSDTDYPFNLMVILGYIVVFLTGVWNVAAHGDKVSTGVARTGLKLLSLGVVRTGLWLFILVRNRYPVRITHSLYLMEACVLFGLLLTEYTGIEKRMEGRIKAAMVFPLTLCFTALLTVPGSIKAVGKEFAGRETVMATDRAVREYCAAHPENFYFRDVYATVSETLPSGETYPYAEKLFEKPGPVPANHDLMGGWLVKSPLYEKKLGHFGIASMAEALLTDERVYLMADKEAGTQWLTGYFAEEGLETEIERVDMVGGRICVYRVRGSQVSGS